MYQCGSKGFMNINSFNAHKYKAGTFIISTLQTRKLRHEELTQPTQGHTARIQIQVPFYS